MNLDDEVLQQKITIFFYTTPTETSLVCIDEFLKGRYIKIIISRPSREEMPSLQQTEISSEEMVLRILILSSQQYLVGFSRKQLQISKR